MKYMDAGVKEYWMVAPDRKAVFVYHMEEAAPVEIYRFCDQVPMGIFGGECKVDFGKITRRIQFL